MTTIMFLSAPKTARTMCGYHAEFWRMRQGEIDVIINMMGWTGP
jgi:hypothetical protein